MSSTFVQQSRRVVTGEGALDRLPAELAACGINRALVICGPHVAAGPALALVEAAAGPALAARFDRCSGNAPLGVVDEIVREARESQVDGLVSVGGGSVHDAAKGASVLLGEGGRLADHATRFVPPDQLVVPPLRGRRIPIVAIGTTLSASEATISAGFADPATRTKIVVVDAAAPVRSVILDPRLAATTPRAVLAASAGNALNHCVEAILSRGHGPMTDALASSALRLLTESAADAVGGDLAALAACQVGAYLSGLAMPAEGLGVNHAVCHVLGVHGAGHGAANSAMLVHGMRFNEPYTADRQPVLAGAMPATGLGVNESVRALLDEIGAPTRLREVGVDRDAMPEIAALALHDRHMFANPRPVHDAKELEELLREAW
ncbi:iron-containing alcohol dehydrogenase family protein [Actinophytocola sp.]|uniref:iron-containing alcohol dehydrogenase family protein n=1 Tax=Actinophytocola sp. TaxID=1872138 RepID=UPI002ED7A7F2